jgi:lipoprotein-anchoring transpeptidase ErfK/SrfK
VLVATCSGFAYAGLTTTDPDVSPIAQAMAEAWGLRPTGAAAGSATAGEGVPTSPTHAAEVARSASADLSRRAEAVEMRALSQALAAARRGGGSPTAIVVAPTALRAAPGGRVLAQVGTETEFGSPRVQAVVGRDREWLEVMAAEMPNGQTAWVSADDVDVEGIDYSLRADLGGRTLEVHRHGRVIRQVTVAVGGAGTPTPTGEFAVTDKLRMTDESSTYGRGVLAFTGHQPTVPQGWSGGDRLAVHGTPHEDTIGQAASLGCFRAGEADMHWLIHRVPLGTPVTITP